jgi:hypothetical protein
MDIARSLWSESLSIAFRYTITNTRQIRYESGDIVPILIATTQDSRVSLSWFDDVFGLRTADPQYQKDLDKKLPGYVWEFLIGLKEKLPWMWEITDYDIYINSEKDQKWQTQVTDYMRELWYTVKPRMTNGADMVLRKKEGEDTTLRDALVVGGIGLSISWFAAERYRRHRKWKNKYQEESRTIPEYTEPLEVPTPTEGEISWEYNKVEPDANETPPSAIESIVSIDKEWENYFRDDEDMKYSIKRVLGDIYVGTGNNEDILDIFTESRSIKERADDWIGLQALYTAFIIYLWEKRFPFRENFINEFKQEIKRYNILLLPSIKWYLTALWVIEESSIDTLSRAA